MARVHVDGRDTRYHRDELRSDGHDADPALRGRRRPFGRNRIRRSRSVRVHYDYRISRMPEWQPPASQRQLDGPPRGATASETLHTPRSSQRSVKESWFADWHAPCLNAESMGPRHPAIWLLTFGLLLAAPLSHAQSTDYGTTARRSPELPSYRDDNTLNKAECIRNDTFRFTVKSTTTDSLSDYQLEVWAGNGCADKAQRITNPECRLVFNGDANNDTGTAVTVYAQEIVADGDGKEPTEATVEDCESSVGGITDVVLYFLLVDGNNDAPEGGDWAEYPIKFDMSAPDAPTN